MTNLLANMQATAEGGVSHISLRVLSKQD